MRRADQRKEGEDLGVALLRRSDLHKKRLFPRVRRQEFPPTHRRMKAWNRDRQGADPSRARERAGSRRSLGRRRRYRLEEARLLTRAARVRSPTRAVPGISVAILHGHLPVAEEPHPIEFAQAYVADDCLRHFGELVMG